MNQMDLPFIIEMAAFAATAVFYSAMILTQKSRRAKVLQKAGDCLYEMAKPAKSKTMTTFFAIPCVMVAAFAVNYSAYFVILVCAVCALAVFIVCKEDANSYNTGIYQNALIAGGSYIEWNKIKSVSDGQFLQIELVDGKKLQIQTASEEESKAVLEAVEKARANS